MSRPNTSLCVGVGPDGKIVSTLDPADGPTATWTVAGVDGQNTIQAISCLDSPSLCVAVDQQRATSSFRPTRRPRARSSALRTAVSVTSARIT